MNIIYLKTTDHNRSLDHDKNTMQHRVMALAHDFEDGDDSLYKIFSYAMSEDELFDMFKGYGTQITEIEAHILGKILQPDREIPDSASPTGKVDYTFDTIIPMDVATATAIKNKAINSNTGSLIENGKHTYSEKDYSTSKNAQNNIIADRIDYDDGVLTDASDDRCYSLTDDTKQDVPCSEIKAFYANMKTVINNHVKDGQDLRDTVNACTTIQDIIDVDDAR